MSKHQRPVRKIQKKSIRREVEVVVESIGVRGDGIASDGQDVIYVPFTLPGEQVRARVERRRGQGVAAALLEVKTASEDRVKPPCRHFGTCGGCALQHMTDQTYTRWKRKLLMAALGKGGLGTYQIKPVVRLDLRTRRRAGFALRRGRSSATLGFMERQSHNVVDLQECLILRPELVALLPGLRALCKDLTIITGGVLVTLADNGLDVLVEGDASPRLAARERLAAFANEYDLARLSWRSKDTGLDEPIVTQRTPTVSFADVPVDLPAGSFLQPSKEGEAAISSLVLEALGQTGEEGTERRILDLYAGVGSFTFPLAEHGSVHAVEGNSDAINALKAAASRKRLSNVTAEYRDLARTPMTADELAPYDVVVFDPPRVGAKEQVREIALGGPQTVVAVSCYPPTFARDARMLFSAGYKLVWVAPIDQFPFSAHLELVALFERKADEGQLFTPPPLLSR